MTVKIAWASYLLLSFVLVPIAFLVRYRRSPYVMPAFPLNRYAWIETVYALCVLSASAFLFLQPAHPIHVPVGLVVMLIGVALVMISVVQMGPSWRIGQDEGDETTVRVDAPLYRVLRHPIYVGLVVIAGAIVMMGGLVAGPLVLLVSTLVYVVLQARAEGAHWRARSAHQHEETPA